MLYTKQMCAGHMSLLTKEIQLGNATRGDICKIAITLWPNYDTSIQTASCVVTKFSQDSVKQIPIYSWNKIEQLRTKNSKGVGHV